MAVVYTPIFRLPLMTRADPAVRDSWGAIVATAFTVLENAIAGRTPVNIEGLSSYTVSTANNQPDQAGQAMLQFTGLLSADCTITIPAQARIGWIRNATAGDHRLILTTGSGTTLSVPPGATYLYDCDGANVQSVPLSASQTLDAAGGLVMGNGASLSARDAQGFTRNLLKLGTDNITVLQAGSTAGIRVLDRDAGVQLSWSGATGWKFTGTVAVGQNLDVTGTTLLRDSLTVGAGKATVLGGPVTMSGAATGASLTLSGTFTTNGGATFAAGAIIGRSSGLYTQDQQSQNRLTLFLDPANFLELRDAGGAGIRIVNRDGNAFWAEFASDHVSFYQPVFCSQNVESTGGQRHRFGYYEASTGNAGVVTGWQMTAGGTGAFSQGGVQVGFNATNLDMLAQRFIAASDGRDKTQIEAVDPALAERFVRKVEPRGYVKNGLHEYGYIAQDLLHHEFEHLVYEAKAPGMPLERNGYTGREGYRYTVERASAVPLLHVMVKQILAELDTIKDALEQEGIL